mmetsp:Transcript_69586/g.185229  ORF Transcript_69586/g.185229 Transcript_69586/m.185229 type:complete len:225 (+) Transcript_69586:870-1544(+)
MRERAVFPRRLAGHLWSRRRSDCALAAVKLSSVVESWLSSSLEAVVQQSSAMRISCHSFVHFQFGHVRPGHGIRSSEQILHVHPLGRADCNFRLNLRRLGAQPQHEMARFSHAVGGGDGGDGDCGRGSGSVCLVGHPAQADGDAAGAPGEPGRPGDAGTNARRRRQNRGVGGRLGVGRRRRHRRFHMLPTAGSDHGSGRSQAHAVRTREFTGQGRGHLRVPAAG